MTSSKLERTAPLGISLASFAMLVAFGLACGGDDDGETEEKVKKGTLEFGAGEVLYEGVEESDAQKLGDILVKLGYLKEDKTKSVGFEKDGETWVVRLVVADETLGDSLFKRRAPMFAMRIAAQAFDGDDLRIELCNTDFETKSSHDRLEGDLIERNGGELYYTAAVEKATAEGFADGLEDFGILGDSVVMRLHKDGDTWHLYGLAPEGLQATPEEINGYRADGLRFSNLLGGEKVKVIMSENLDSAQLEVETPNGTRLEFNKGILYYTPEVGEELATKLGEFLVKDKFFDGTPTSVRVHKDGDRYAVQLIIKAEAIEDKKYMKILGKFKKKIDKKVFGKQKMDLQLCDPYFNTHKVL